MTGPTVYRFADVVLDPATGCLLRDGREHYPRPKSLQVLLYLIEHRDRIVTKDELIAGVWNEASATDDLLFHSIREIRTLLGDTRREPRFIRTHHGAGYRFIAELLEETPAVAPPRRARFPRAALWIVLAAAACAGLGLYLRKRPLSPAEVAWWRFDERSGATVTDSAGRARGTLLGNAVRIEGVAGAALEFDGVASRAMGAGGAFPSGDAPRTITGWIRTQSANGDETAILHYGGNYVEGFALWLRPDGRAGGLNATVPVAGRAPLADGAWHFLALAYDGAPAATARLFVDGEEEAVRRLTRPLPTRGSGWSIGRFVGAGTPFRGAIDDVRVFGSALHRSRIRALYRCGIRARDLEGPDGQFYAFSMFPDGDAAIEPSGEIRHRGAGYGGVQYARSDGLCGVESLRGASFGDDVYVAADLLTPSASGGVTAAGPYFRSRAAAPADGIIGGTSAGFWVQLYSDGVVKVRMLNPHQVVAFTAPAAGFDAGRTHRLEAWAKGRELRVHLDGAPLEFDQAGRRVATVALLPQWQGPPAIGENRGTAGFAFSSEPRGAAGGQQAGNIVLRSLR